MPPDKLDIHVTPLLKILATGLIHVQLRFFVVVVVVAVVNGKPEIGLRTSISQEWHTITGSLSDWQA